MIKKHFNSLVNFLADGFFPSICVFCRQRTYRPHSICKACYPDLPWLIEGCQCCSTPIYYAGDERLCGRCLQNPPIYRRVHALFHYQFPIPSIISALKYRHSLVMARLLGEFLTQHIQTQWYLHQQLPEILIPIPLHPKRLRERGFNQSVEIARPIARALNISIKTHGLQRIQPTLPQVTLPFEKRQKNVQDAFALTAPITHQHVAVIDDVMTTGATVQAFCHLLHQNGVKIIDVWCIARPSDNSPPSMYNSTLHKNG